LHGDRLEAAPVAGDLIESLLFEVVMPGAVLFNTAFPKLGGAGILPAVLESLGQGVQGALAVVRFAIVGDLLIDAQIVELLGQFESLDAVSQPGDGFVLGKRV
jgi:hypothetical protein